MCLSDATSFTSTNGTLSRTIDYCWRDQFNYTKFGLGMWLAKCYSDLWTLLCTSWRSLYSLTSHDLHVTGHLYGCWLVKWYGAISWQIYLVYNVQKIIIQKHRPLCDYVKFGSLCNLIWIMKLEIFLHRFLIFQWWIYKIKRLCNHCCWINYRQLPCACLTLSYGF